MCPSICSPNQHLWSTHSVPSLVKGPGYPGTAGQKQTYPHRVYHVVIIAYISIVLQQYVRHFYKHLSYLLLFFFLIILFYLFIFGCVGSSLLHMGFLQLRQAGAALHCGPWASHCGGFSCCRVRALGAGASVVVARGLWSAGSVVVAHGLSCSMACGIFPDRGSNPCPLHWQADS